MIAEEGDTLKYYRWLVAHFMVNPWVGNFTILAIIVNGSLMGVQTDYDLPAAESIDYFFLWFFTIELFLKIFAFGFAFFEDGWNLMDFFIVPVCNAVVSYLQSIPTPFPILPFPYRRSRGLK